jgi:hypothetical protein
MRGILQATLLNQTVTRISLTSLRSGVVAVAAVQTVKIHLHIILMNVYLRHWKKKNRSEEGKPEGKVS